MEALGLEPPDSKESSRGASQKALGFTVSKPSREPSGAELAAVLVAVLAAALAVSAVGTYEHLASGFAFGA